MVDNQNLQNQQLIQAMKSNEIRLFYQAPNSNNNDIYNITCKKIPQDYLQYLDFMSYDYGDYGYDYDFIFESLDDSTTIFHATCKLLSHSLVVNILNKTIYGMDFDVGDLNHRYLLTLRQKLSLEQNLKQILPSHFSQRSISDVEMRIEDSYDNSSSSDGGIEENNSFDVQDHFIQ